MYCELSVHSFQVVIRGTRRNFRPATFLGQSKGRRQSATPLSQEDTADMFYVTHAPLKATRRMSIQRALQCFKQRLKSWGLPTSDEALPSIRSTTETQQTIPDPGMFTDLCLPVQTSQLDIEVSDVPLIYPTVGQCACHLALLECFSRLKRKVMLSKKIDQIFGINGEFQEKCQEHQCGEQFSGDVLAGVPENASQKWELFVELACSRFAKWWENIDQVFEDMCRAKPQNGGLGEMRKSRVGLTKDQLPPLGTLDGVLILHSFGMLTLRK